MSRVEGVVLGRRGHQIHVLASGKEIAATLRGRLKYQDGSRIVAGDRVVLNITEGAAATVEEIAPRRSVLARRAGHARRTKPVAANIDSVFAVVAAKNPAPNARFLDRLLVIAEANDLLPIIVANKIDLDPAVPETLDARYRPAGYIILATSAKTGEGIAELRNHLVGKTSVLTGSSGVGKSSLLNAVEPGLGLRTREVSEYWGTGKHTTVAAQLVPIQDGGFVVDTPGLREAALWDVSPERLVACFPEFAPQLGRCRFTDCRHFEEPECAVHAAAVAGDFDEDRLATYRRMRDEAERSSRHWE